MVIASYAAERRVVLLRLTALSPVLVLVAGLIGLLTTTTPGPPREVLFVAFAGIGAFSAYYFGFRQVYLVELTPVELRWREALRDGAAPLADVQSIRCSKASRSRGVTVDVATVEFTSRRPLKFGASAPRPDAIPGQGPRHRPAGDRPATHAVRACHRRPSRGMTQAARASGRRPAFCR
jgi:hypothetical protein